MIDFHIHTTCSDGALSPAEILKRAEKLGLTHLSITDHFSVSAYEQLCDPAIRSLFSGKILLGTEFSVHLNGRPVDLLGFGLPFEQSDAYIKKTYPPLEVRRRKKIIELQNTYTERGYRFDNELVEQYVYDGGFWQDIFRRALVKYPENIARFTNPDSATNTKSFMYCEINNPASPFYIDASKSLPSIEEVCAFIRENGGVSILAHPGMYDRSTQDMIEEMIQVAKPDGLEVWYAQHTPEQRAQFASLCEKHNLIFSAGSDYHNDAREAAGNVLGIPAYKDLCPIEQILQWAEKLPMI